MVVWNKWVVVTERSLYLEMKAHIGVLKNLPSNTFETIYVLREKVAFYYINQYKLNTFFRLQTLTACRF